MAARSKYITTTVDEETWRAVRDAANLWGESLSLATYRLVQRGISSLDEELGSRTPAHIKLSRIHQDLQAISGTRQTVVNDYKLAQDLGDEKMLGRIEEVAEELGIKL